MKITDISGTVTLNNSVEMPYFGLGLFQNKDWKEVIKTMNCAWKNGYRLFDTASIYKNEVEVGNAVREMGIDRKELFLTSKVWNNDQGYNSTLQACDDSLNRMGLDYLDLYLIHWPVKGEYVETWNALEALYKSGKVRAIGVSNFLRHHLDDILKNSSIVPMVNQLEFHPWLIQEELLSFHNEQSIAVQGWAPLMRGKIFEIQLFKELSIKYRKSAAQLVLRWNLQKGVLVIPKSAQPDRIINNSCIFDFEISEDDMTKIDLLDRNQRIGPDPDNFSF